MILKGTNHADFIYILRLCYFLLLFHVIEHYVNRPIQYASDFRLKNSSFFSDDCNIV